VSTHAVALLAGWGGTALGFWMSLAQFRRARREGVAGIAIATWSIFTFMGVFWIAYGIEQHSLVIWLSAAVCQPLQIALVFLLNPLVNVRRVIRALAIVGLGCYLPGVLFGWSAGVYGAGAVMMWNRVPQIAELVRTKHAEGLSVGSWIVGSLCSTLWILYYAVFRNWAPLVATSVALLGNLLIVGLGTWRHLTAREHATT